MIRLHRVLNLGISILALITILYTIFFIPFQIGLGYNVYNYQLDLVVDILFDVIFFLYLLRRFFSILLRSLFFKKKTSNKKAETEKLIWDLAQKNIIVDYNATNENIDNNDDYSTVFEEQSVKSHRSTSEIRGVVKYEKIKKETSQPTNDNGSPLTDNLTNSSRPKLIFDKLRHNLLLYLLHPNNLLLDLCCCIPFDYILGDLIRNTAKTYPEKTIYYQLLLRIPRLARIYRYHELVNSLLIDPQSKPKWFLMMNLFFLFLILQHWFACLWCFNTVIPFTGEKGVLDGGSTFWSTVYFSKKKTYWTITNTFDTSIANPNSPYFINRWTRYVSVLYFICWNFLSVGLGDMHSQNNSERILNCIIILIGAICLSFIIGNISVFIYEYIALSNERKLESETLALWMTHYDAPPFIKEMALSHLLILNENTPIEVAPFMVGLPPTFAASIVTWTHSDLFRDSEVLGRISQELKYALSPQLYFNELSPGDVIAEIGTPVKNLVFVTGGLFEGVIDLPNVTVEQELSDNSDQVVAGGTPIAYYSQHSVPSISAIMSNKSETCTIRALTHCILITIEASTFLKILTCGLYDSDYSYFWSLAGLQSRARIDALEYALKLQRRDINNDTDNNNNNNSNKNSNDNNNNNNNNNDNKNNDNNNNNNNNINNCKSEFNIAHHHHHSSHGTLYGTSDEEYKKNDSICSINMDLLIGSPAALPAPAAAIAGNPTTTTTAGLTEEISYLNDIKVLKSTIPFSRFQANPKVWKTVIRTKHLYLFTSADCQTQRLSFPACRAYLANFFGIRSSWLVGSQNRSKAVELINDEEFHELLHRGVIPPGLPAKSKWDMLISLLVIYAVTVTPLVLGFQIDNPVTGNLELFVTSAFFFDIIISSRCTEASLKSVPVDTVPYTLLVNYLHGPFFIDFISTMPWDYISQSFLSGSVAAQNLSVIRVIRLLRLTRILKLAKLRENLLRVKSIRDFITNNRTGYELLVMAIQILYLCHLFGSFFSFFIVIQNDTRHWWASNILAENGYILDPTQPTVATVFVRYLAAYYWAMSTLSTTGIGDIYATSSISQTFAIFAMTIGVILFAIFAGKIASVIESRSLASYIRHAIINWYTLASSRNDPSENVPIVVRKRIADFHRIRLRQDSHIDASPILNKLPYYIRRKVMLAVNEDIAHTLPLAVLKRYYLNKYACEEKKIDINNSNVPAEFAYAIVSNLRARWMMPLENGAGNCGLGIASAIVTGAITVGYRTIPLQQSPRTSSVNNVLSSSRAGSFSDLGKRPGIRRESNFDHRSLVSNGSGVSMPFSRGKTVSNLASLQASLPERNQAFLSKETNHKNNLSQLSEDGLYDLLPGDVFFIDDIDKYADNPLPSFQIERKHSTSSCGSESSVSAYSNDASQSVDKGLDLDWIMKNKNKNNRVAVTYAKSITKVMILDVDVHDKILSDYQEVLKTVFWSPNRMEL